MDIFLNKTEEDNSKLKKLLDKSSESGKIAYNIGNIAKEIKDNQSYKKLLNDETVEPYKDFAEYCKLELNKAEDTIKKYIRIAESFQDESEVSEIMVTHLHELVRIKNDSIRKIVSKAYKKHLKEYHFGKKAPKHTPFNKRTLKRIVNKIKNTKNLSEKVINEIINRVISLHTIENGKEQKTDVLGKVLQSKKIDIKLFARTPIDEQGTVALFCVIFEQLCKVQFRFDINGRSYNKNSIS
ncbi:MAG: hypothetical protein AB8G11_25480 [Saprospiraceae bacterium]